MLDEVQDGRAGGDQRSTWLRFGQAVQPGPDRMTVLVEEGVEQGSLGLAVPVLRGPPLGLDSAAAIGERDQ